MTSKKIVRLEFYTSCCFEFAIDLITRKNCFHMGVGRSTNDFAGSQSGRGNKKKFGNHWYKEISQRGWDAVSLSSKLKFGSFQTHYRLLRVYWLKSLLTPLLVEFILVSYRVDLFDELSGQIIFPSIQLPPIYELPKFVSF